VLDISGYNTQIGSLSGGGDVVLGSAMLTVGGDNRSPEAYAGVISGAGGLTKIGSGILTLSGANTYHGSTMVIGGTLKAGVESVADMSGAFGNNSAVTLSNAAGVVLDISGYNTQIGSLSGGGDVVLGSAMLTVGGDNRSPEAYAGVISGIGGLIKIGSGKLTLSGANTYHGPTKVIGGTLKAGVESVGDMSGAFGNNSAVTLSNAAGVVLDISGYDTQIGSLTGGGTSGGDVVLGSAMLTVGGDNNRSPETYAGVISGIGGLIKIGSGIMTLSGANTYHGPTKVIGGTLKAGVESVADMSGAFGKNSAVTLSNAAGVVLDISGYNTQIGSLSGGGDAVLGSAMLTVGGDNRSPEAYAGVISGIGGLIKIGSGIMTLSGANTYHGPTKVIGGTLKA
jgi:autotransporter-associated beta strand protein